MKHNVKMIYDVTALPENLRVDTLLKIADSHNAVFFDSTRGTRPRFVEVGEDAPIPTLVDTKGEVKDFDKFLEMQVDKEYWDRELYNCKKSPIYYFTHYKTEVWPVEQPKLTAYLESIGLGDISSSDSTTAAQKWEDQKAAVAAATKDFTIEHLQELKPKVDLLKELYNQNVVKYENFLAHGIKLLDKNGEPLEEKLRSKRIRGYIKQQPVLSEYSGYRTKKQEWDSQMLVATDYSELLVIAYKLSKLDENFKVVADTDDKAARDRKVKKALGVGN